MGRIAIILLAVVLAVGGWYLGDSVHGMCGIAVDSAILSVDGTFPCVAYVPTEDNILPNIEYRALYAICGSFLGLLAGLFLFGRN